MAWNHRENVVAVGVTIQAGAGVYNAPGVNDLMAVSNITNTREPVTTDDPTATGTVWKPPRILLGKTGTVGFTFPLRGFGAGGLPLANAFPFGRLMQSAGYAEIRTAAAVIENLQAGSTTTALRLAAGQSAVDDFWFGVAIQHAAIGAGALGGSSLVVDYLGATKDAIIAELLGVAPAGATQYTIPAQLTYVQGTLTTAPPLLSVSVWRDKLRYNYVDCRPTQLGKDVPVGNEYNTGFPAVDVSLKGKLYSVQQEAAPQVPAAVRAVPIPPAKGGKFLLDRVVLGHGGIKWTNTYEVGAPSNQNQADGIDAYEIMSGTGVLNLDLNQADLGDFDFSSREDAQTIMTAMSTWGAGVGNRFGLTVAGVVIDPLNTGARNGFVSLTGDAFPVDVDKRTALTIW